MSHTGVQKRHYLVALLLVVLVLVLLLSYWRMVQTGSVPDVRPFLLGQAVIVQEAPDAQPEPDTTLVPMPMPFEPIAAGAQQETTVEPAEASTDSTANVNDVADDGLPPMPSMADTPSIPEWSDRVEQPEDLPEVTQETLDTVGEELALTPGAESEGQQVPRLDLDINDQQLSRLVREGHLMLVLQVRDRRSRPRIYQAEPAGQGYRVRELSADELEQISTRHLGGGNGAFAQGVLRQTSGALANMSLQAEAVSIRFDRGTDARLVGRQLQALEQAGIRLDTNEFVAISTQGRLVVCDGQLDLVVTEVRSGARRISTESPVEHCRG